MKFLRLFFLFLVLLGWALAVPSASMASEKSKPEKGVLTAAEEKWGIRILSIRPTAAGHLLDLRFRVIDEGKAAGILSDEKKPFIIDQKSKLILPVPVTKSGALRQTTTRPQKGRTYFFLFSNPQGLVREGTKVTLVIGDLRAEDIIVGSAGEPLQVESRELPEMTDTQRKQWNKVEKVQGTLRREYGICVEHCGKDTGCLERCKRAFETRLEREYQRLLLEKN
jgi:hypothetical protein